MSDPTLPMTPHGDPPNEKAKAVEKLLDRAFAKCDSTKKDLDTLWTTQILAVVLSVALVAGPNAVAVSQLMCHSDNCGDALYVLLPIVNLYFMMRFGFLTFAFSKARSAAEVLSKRFIEERELSKYIRDDRNAHDHMRIDHDLLYSTNSFFELFYTKFSSTSDRALVYVYNSFIPLVFALSHSTSIYLLLRVLFPKFGAWTFIFIAVYVAILIALYTTLSKGLLKGQIAEPKLVIFIVRSLDLNPRLQTGRGFSRSIVHRLTP